MTSTGSKNFLKVLADPQNATVDIVAVHGLNPTNKESHAEGTWTAANGKLWLKDFLPEELPQARIFLYGYNSNVAFATSTAGVDEHADNLLNRLKLKRRACPKRPIIFICHSLGGIIAKKALTNAQLDMTYKPIANATYGLVFFGTPHQGGSFTSLGNIAATIARNVLRNPSNNLLEALTKDSLYADTIIKAFRHQLENYYVLSFFETLNYGKAGLIVDQKSATLGLAGTREIMIALDADHSGLCRFPSTEDDNYEQVSGNIIEMVEKAAAMVVKLPEDEGYSG